MRAAPRPVRVGAQPAEMVLRAEPVGAPLPDVPRHVVEPVAVRREGVDRRGAIVAVLDGVAGREPPLPDVHPMLAAGRQLVAPGELALLQATPSGVLPFR